MKSFLKSSSFLKFMFFCCCSFLLALIFNNVKNQHNSDLSPAFKPGSYVQNAVDTSIKGMYLQLYILKVNPFPPEI